MVDMRPVRNQVADCAVAPKQAVVWRAALSSAAVTALPTGMLVIQLQAESTLRGKVHV